MKDFRDRIVKRLPDRSEVIALLRQGQLAKALRAAKRGGVKVSQDEIDATAKKMFDGGRAGELLAMVEVHNSEIQLPYEKRALFVRTFEKGDHHTFLKQAHRLGEMEGIEPLIKEAILAIGRRNPKEVYDWRRKFRVT